jgi:hypothetical protein
MASGYTALGFILQETGENETTWGAFLNSGGLSLIDAAIRGRVAFVLSGSKILSSTNGVDTEGRKAILHATSGTGGAVTIPGYSKIYVAINDTAGDMVITAGGAENATFSAGESGLAVCDGEGGVLRLQTTNFAGLQVIVGSPLSDFAAATKKYVDDTAFEVAAGNLPGQTGKAGKFLGTDGATPSWSSPFPDQAGNDGKQLFTDGTDLYWDDINDQDAVVAQSVSGATTLDFSAGRNFELTLTGNLSLAVPTGMSSGQSGVLWFIQDGTGSRLLTTNAAIKRVGGRALTLSTSAGSVDRCGYIVRNGALELTALERGLA